MDPKIEVKEEPVWLDGTATSSLPSANIKEERLIKELVPCIKEEDTSRPDLSHEDPPPSLGPECFNCDMCGKVLASRKSILKHLEGHTGDHPFKCVHCEKNFKYSSKLSVHMRTHTGEKPYLCTVCGKSFSQKGPLSRHHRKHTGLKPYACSVCNKTFADSGNLAKHMRIHTGEKPYYCTICNMRFRQSVTLSRHLKSHRGERLFKCSVCCKALSRKSHLQDHMSTHTGERRYKCNECGMSFIASSHLTRHISTHTGDRPNKCNECGYQLFPGFNCYKAFPSEGEMKTWSEARATCTGDGGDLMVIETERERKEVIIPLYKSVKFYYYPWVGVYIPQGGNDWTTVKGEPARSTWWRPADELVMCPSSARSRSERLTSQVIVLM